jgi:hypothetical protein
MRRPTGLETEWVLRPGRLDRVGEFGATAEKPGVAPDSYSARSWVAT